MEGRRRFRVLILTALAAAVAAGAAYWMLRSPCVETGPGMRGEVQVRSDGTHLYFDGTCWTTTPMPPRDMPF